MFNFQINFPIINLNMRVENLIKIASIISYQDHEQWNA